ncbi:MAG: hypothetical protein COB36_11395 [Alphaproteobacteria bacterium]|nr:MAG: hypothetical protein COB36_11395 [Alphaproteobacteria bacterium]
MSSRILNKEKFGTALMSAVVAMALTSGATAQESAKAKVKGAFNLEEIVVTATKREENMQQVPVAMSVMGESELDRQGLQTLQDLQYEIPNMTMYVVSAFASWINMRGVPSNPNGVFNSGTSPGLGVYVDGVVFARQTGFNQELSNIERVEVLRGPQGTLFGQNTNLGVISYTTKKPGDEVEGKIKLEYGSFKSRKVNAYVSGPLIEGKLAVGASAFLVKGNGAEVSSYDGESAFEEDRKGGRFQVRATPTDQTTIDLSANIMRGRGSGITRGDVVEIMPGGLTSNLLFFSTNPFGTGPAGLEPFAADMVIYEGPRTVSVRTDGNNAIRDEYGLDGTISHELENGITLKSITAYKNYDSRLEYEFSATAMEALQTYQSEANSQFTQEFQLLSSTDEKLEYVAGLFYLNNKAVNNQGMVSGKHLYFVRPVGSETIVDATVDTKSAAAFGNITYNFTESTSVFAGLRYSDVSKDVVFEQDDNLLIFGFADVPRTERTQKDSFLSWTGGVNHHIETDTSDMNVFAKISRGYKEGGFTIRALSRSEIGDPNNPTFSFDREEVTNYEIGLKGTFFDNRLRLNLAAFYLDYIDIQTNAIDENDIQRITNGPSAVSKGFEVDAVFIASDYVRLTASVGMADARFGEFSNCSPTTDCTGNRLPFNSKWTVSTGLDYDFPVTDNWSVFGGVDVNYRSARFSTPDNLFPPKAHTIVNSQIGFRPEDSGLQIMLLVKNVLDNDNIINQTTSNTFNYRTIRYSPPRSWTLQATYEF